jgi:hypothetical protein
MPGIFKFGYNGLENPGRVKLPPSPAIADTNPCPLKILVKFKLGNPGIFGRKESKDPPAMLNNGARIALIVLIIDNACNSNDNVCNSICGILTFPNNGLGNDGSP